LEVAYSSLWETYRRASKRHLPYGITHCYLLPDPGECAPSHSQPDRPIPIPDG